MIPLRNLFVCHWHVSINQVIYFNVAHYKERARARYDFFRNFRGSFLLTVRDGGSGVGHDIWVGRSS